MDLDEAVTRLTSLTLILHDTDITQAVHDLAGSALAVVPSSLAVLITLGDTRPLAAVTPRYREGVAQVRSTLRLEFTGPEPSGGGPGEDPPSGMDRRSSARHPPGTICRRSSSTAT